jgi:N-acetylglucosamine-6-sulfatase
MRAALIGLLILLPLTAVAQPNVVFILTDDQTTDEMVALPYTKHLVGGGGITFNRGYVNDALCSPSRATILTGQYAQNHGVNCNEGPNGGYEGFLTHHVSERSFVIPMHKAGYRTAMIGKYVNHTPVGYRPEGWDQWIDCIGGTCDQGYRYWLDVNGTEVSYRTFNGEYDTDVLTDKAVDFIKSTPANTPLLLYWAPSAPHDPATPAHRHESLFPDAKVPRNPAFNEADVNDKPEMLRLPLMTAAEIDARDTHYRDQLRTLVAVDEGVKRIHDALQATGRLSRTHFIFLSDNGFKAGTHRFPSGKNTNYEPDIHVPFMMNGPGIPAGQIDNDHIVVNADIAPTILAWAGLSQPDWTDGRSLRLLAQGRLTTPWRQLIPIERTPAGDERTDPEIIPPAKGIRSTRYTWTEWANGDRELYDNQVDPYQVNNIAGLDPSLDSLLANLAARALNCAGTSCRTAEILR